MTSKAIVTAVASVALAGGALVVVTAPASSAAPGCQYPANIVTTTSLRVVPSTVQFGNRANAKVRVNATGTSRNPTGRAIVTVAGQSVSKSLSGGSASIRLPKLSRGNYTVRAKYDPNRCSHFQKSSSGPDSLRVGKAHSRAHVNVANINRGQRPKARVHVGTSTGVTAKGKARVRISRHGTSFAKTVRLHGGSASTKFKALNKVGKWKVRVSYKGTGNIRPDSGSDTFRVKRRR